MMMDVLLVYHRMMADAPKSILPSEKSFSIVGAMIPDVARTLRMSRTTPCGLSLLSMLMPASEKSSLKREYR